MKKVLFFLSLCFMTVGSVLAQDARTILDQALSAYTKAGGMTVTFSLDTKDTKANHTYSQDGTAWMKADKFKIELPEAITWFDGKTQWTYIKNTEEVNITNPTGKELQAISPSVLFSIYKNGFDLKYKGEKNVKGKAVQIIELTAQDKKADLKKILVEINKADKNFSKIVLYDTNEMENTLTINSYQQSANLGDNTFTFDKADFPDAEIVDLR